MFKVFRIFFVLMASLSFTQQKVVDYLHLGNFYRFEDKEYKLVWSSNPTKGYYKQEYILPGEKVEKYTRMIVVDFIVNPSLSTKDAVAYKIQELKEAQKKNPVIQYKVYEKGDGYVLDFIISANSADGKSIDILERDVYHYFPANTSKGKGVVLFAVSDRAYTSKEMDKMFEVLKENRMDLINKVAAIKKLEVR